MQRILSVARAVHGLRPSIGIISFLFTPLPTNLGYSPQSTLNPFRCENLSGSIIPNYKVVWFHLRKREPIALPSPLTIRESRIALPRAAAAPAGAQARRKSSPFGTHVRSPRVPPGGTGPSACFGRPIFLWGHEPHSPDKV